MCNFKSAIVTKDGVILHHELTDSHSELIQHFKLHERRGPGQVQNFIKVEFTPTDLKFDDPASYVLWVDETETPAWFDEDAKHKTSEFLRDVITKMIIRDKREILLGGAWILSDGAEVGNCLNAKIAAMCGGTLTAMWGGTLTAMRGGTLT